MNIFLGLGAIVLCFGYISSSADFDCRRISQPCVTGECDDTSTSGSCICPTDAAGAQTHTGKDCGVELANVATNPADCDPPCENSGICMNNAGTFECECNEAFYGTSCSMPRKEVQCSGDSMTIMYTPIMPFNGLVFIVDQQANTECAFTQDAATNTYSATIPYTGTCGVTTTPDDPNTGDTSYTLNAVVQFDQNIEMTADIGLEARCVIEGSGISAMSNDFGSVSVNQRNNLTKEMAQTDYQPVSFSLQAEDGSPLPENVYIGDKVRMYIPLADTGKYSSLKITELTVGNGLGATDANLVNIPLISGGCLTDAGKSLITGDVIVDASVPALIVNFLVFRVKGSTNVEFQSTVQVCTDTMTECDASVCPPPPAQGRRRRRSAENNQVILHETLRVLDPRSDKKPVKPSIPSDTTEKSTTNYTNTEQCLQSSEILIMVIVLIVAVVLLLVITLCMAVKFMKQRAQVKVYNNSEMPTGNNMVRIQRPTF